MLTTVCPRCGTDDPLGHEACWTCSTLSDEEAATMRSSEEIMARAATGDPAVRRVTLLAADAEAGTKRLAQHWAVVAWLEANGFATGPFQRSRRGRGAPASWLAWLARIMARDPNTNSAAAALQAAEEVGLERRLAPSEAAKSDANGNRLGDRRSTRYRVALLRARRRGSRIV